MASEKRQYSMESYYKQIGSSRQLYSYRTQAERASEEIITQVIGLVIEWRKRHPKMSARQLHYTISNSGIPIPVGINKFEKIASQQGLNVSIKKHNPTRTSDGKGKEAYANLTKGLELSGINQLIVGDITYYALNNAWTYIFTMKDVYSQRILGLIPSLDMSHLKAIDCLNQVVETRKKKNLNGCIHHTDNGSQYNARDYKNILKSLGIQISRAENCKENGSAEQLNHILKNMYFEAWDIKSFKQLEKACVEFMYLNNNERAIDQLGNISPIEFERNIQEIPVEHRTVKLLYDFNI